MPQSIHQMHALQRFFPKIDLNAIEIFCCEWRGLNDLEVSRVNYPLGALTSIEM